jgi:restriction system protein
MAAKKRRRSKATRRREAKQRIGFAAIVVAAVLFVLWQSPWLLITILCATALTGLGWVLWKAHRREQTGDRAWREQNRRMELERSMATIDAMSWQDFEHYVAELCRRDGCTNVTVTGGSGDLGADVVGTLPDGRHLVAQVKHYAPHRYVPSGDMQKFVGTAKLEHNADVALFVATCPFGKAARDLAVRHDIIAVNRDLFGSWNRGAPLESLLPLNGAGDGPRRKPNTTRKPETDTA